MGAMLFFFDFGPLSPEPGALIGPWANVIECQTTNRVIET